MQKDKKVFLKDKELMKRLEPGRKYRWTGGPLCPKCEGTGLYEGDRCPMCKGIGSISLRAKLLGWWLLPKPFALPSELLPSTVKPGDYTWEMWYRDNKKKHPVRYFFQETLTKIYGRYVKRPLHSLKWWVLYRTTQKYHLIDIRDKGNKYQIGWIDRDRAILFASFALFCKFYEEEKEMLDHGNTGEVMDELYQWWTVERPGKLAEGVYEDDLYDEDTEMLKRLIGIRSHLWS